MYTRMLILFVLLNETLARGNVTLTRRKRHLNFPEGSSVVINLSVAHALVWEYTNPPFPTWNGLLEWDLGFGLANSTWIHPNRKHRGITQWDPRQELFLNIESFLFQFGFNGHECITRALCETKKHLRSGRSLLEDLLAAIFRAHEDEEVSDPTVCQNAFKLCPLSLLVFALQ